MDRDEVFHVLRNRRRRYTLHYLRREERAEIGDIAEQVAAWENEITVPEVDSTQRKRVYNALQQTHLPELDDCDFVEYERGTVELTDRARQLEMYLEVVDGRDIPWSEYYLGLSGVSAGLLAAAWVGVFPVSVVGPLGVAAFVTAAFCFSAVANVLYGRSSRLDGEGPPPEVRRGS